MEKTARTEHQSRMFAIVEKWQESGNTQKQFCREQEIPTARFYYWLKRYKNQRIRTEGFLPVRVEEYPGMNDRIEIIYPNGVRLQTSSGTSVRVIRELVMLG